MYFLGNFLLLPAVFPTTILFCIAGLSRSKNLWLIWCCRTASVKFSSGEGHCWYSEEIGGKNICPVGLWGDLCDLGVCRCDRSACVSSINCCSGDGFLAPHTAPVVGFRGGVFGEHGAGGGATGAIGSGKGD